MAKKVLLVFHLNFLKQDRGCCNYIYMMAKSLKQQGYSIDFFSASVVDNCDADFEKYNKKEKLIDNFYFVKTTKPLFPNSWCNEDICQEFSRIVNANEYDFINIHYIQWADLIRYGNISPKTELIYTMHDSQFMQYNYSENNISVGAKLDDELQKIKLFDKINCISYDEMLFWEHMLPQKDFYFVPHTISVQNDVIKTKKYDVLFLAADNPFNVEGLQWFLDKVYPYITKKIKIAVCGKIVASMRKQYPLYYEKMQSKNFTLIDFCKDLDDLYSKTKTAIVPMFRGTGMKIKTIEAMAYGKPVVSTLLGVDGFPDKLENGVLVTDDAEKFADYIEKLAYDSQFYQNTQNKQNAYFAKYFAKSKVDQYIATIFTSDEELYLQKLARGKSLAGSQSSKANNKQKPDRIFAIKLFNFIGLYEYQVWDNKVKVKVAGLPIFKSLRKDKAVKYYFLGLPFCCVVKEG